MGAHNIEFTIDKKATFSEIRAAFAKQQAEDRIENGVRSYSGDFQTVDSVVDHTHKIFNSFNEAHDYCLHNAEKWVNVVAVYYKSAQFKPNKTAETLRAKGLELQKQLSDLERKPIKLPKFTSCEVCQSKVSSAHLRGVRCPICNEGDFRPLGLQRKIVKLKQKIKLVEGKFNKAIEDLKTKSLQKLGDKSIKTMVAGWGAS